MGITSLSATAAERMAGCVFSEDFYSDARVVENGGTLVSCTADSGVILDGGADYVNYQASTASIDFFNNASLTIFLRFTPDFAYDEDETRYLFSADNTDYALVKGNNSLNNILRLFLGGTQIASIASSAYSDYWTAGSENTIIVSGTTGDTDVYLNGNLILDGDTTAWSPVAVTTNFTIGAYGPGALFFDGTFHKMQVYNTRLSAADIALMAAGTTYDYRDDITTDIDCSAEFYRPTLLQARDITGNDNHAKLGNSLAAGQAPTKTTGRPGYTFDGTDDYLSGITAPTGSYTVTVLERTSGAPALSQANDLTTKWNDIMSPGQYSDELLTLRVHPTVLTDIQKYDEQYQLYRRLNDNDLSGVLLDLDAEGALDFYMDTRSGGIEDWSRQERAVAYSGLSWSGDAINISAAGDYANCTAPKRSECAWFVAGDFSSCAANGAIMSQFETAGDQQYLWDFAVATPNLGVTGNGARSTLATDIDDGSTWTSNGVNIQTGEKPKGFQQGTSLGYYSASVTEGGDTVTHVVGNDHDYDAGLTNADFVVAVVASRKLSENEHRALHAATYQDKWDDDVAYQTVRADLSDNTDGKNPAEIFSLKMAADSDGDFANQAVYTGLVGYGNNVSSVNGRLGYHGVFNGSDSYVNGTGISAYGGQAISLWVKQTASSDDNIADFGGTDSPELCVVSSSLSFVDDPAAATIYVDGVATTAFEENVWQHVVVNSTNYRWDVASFRLGLGVTHGYFEGEIANPRLFNRPLTEAQILALYAEGNTARFETGWGVQCTFGSDASGAISDSPFTVGSGAWSIDVDSADDFFVKRLRCTSAGYCYLPVTTMQETSSDAAYGQWEFSVSKDNTADVLNLYFVATTAAATPAAGYNFEWDGSDDMAITEIGVGDKTTPVSRAAASWYDIKIKRTPAGVFSLYIDDTLIETATDNTTTTSNYIVLDFDAGCEIKWADQDGTAGFVKRLKHEL